MRSGIYEKVLSAELAMILTFPYISASLAAFDTSIVGNTGNAPTSKAVKDYVDTASSSLRKAINDLNHNTGKTGTAGTFLRWVSQTTGQLNSSEVAFSTTPIATGATGAAPAASPTYSSVTDVAPTAKAVADQIRRLDGRADAIRGEITGLNYNTSVACVMLEMYFPSATLVL